VEQWLRTAVEYIPSWMQFQMRASEQPGCIIAVAHRDDLLLEEAFGCADLSTGEKLTPRHRFRVASHSKSFTSAAIMKLREQRKLHLDDSIGEYVQELHPGVAEVTIGQILSHSAGIIRDGADSGQFSDHRPYFDKSELMADFQRPLAIEPNTRFKYSNHGYGLLGVVIEAITKEPYRAWIKREIVDAVGLLETEPDMPIARGAPFARGHTTRLPLGARLVIPGDNPTHAIAPAAGFVSTASDLTRYFAQLAPKAKRSVVSIASRREMIRRQWRNPHASQEGYYGLGIISGTLGGWDWFGHSGGLHGYISRTAVLPAQELTLCVLTNATDGWAGLWVDGMIQILRAFATRGAPTRRVRDWNGRWWSTWGALDLVPMGNVVLGANPHFINPFADATEIEVTGRDKGRIALAGGYQSHGEPVRRLRNKNGAVSELWWSGARLRPEKKVAVEMARRYPSAKSDWKK
jgi:CubicO group peptidase (beta-lactamase class C family)